MTLAERLRAALDAPHDTQPVLLPGDHHEFDPQSIGHAAAVLRRLTKRARPSMLDSLRRHATGWVAKLLFGVLILSFAIWGSTTTVRITG